MQSHKPTDKTEGEKHPPPKHKRLPGWRKFQKLLKQVVKAPPLSKSSV